MRVADERSETGVAEFHPRLHDKRAWNERIKALQALHEGKWRQSRLSTGPRPKRNPQIYRNLRKAVVATHRKTGEVRTFESMTECAASIGRSVLLVSRAAKGVSAKHAGGWLIAYAEAKCTIR